MQAWETFLKTLHQQLGDETFNQWLRPLKLVHFDACNLYLEAEHSFQIEWFEEHIRPLTKKLLRNNNAHPIKIHITSREIDPKIKKKVKTGPILLPTPSFTLLKDPLFPEFSSKNFIFNESNQIFSSLLNSLCQQETLRLDFNPLFFYGPHSSGKTHLLQAFAHALQQRNWKALYVKAETFTENVIQAIRSSNMQEFRLAHRHIDALIFDNVGHLAKKSATQEEFFHTFNALHSQGKLILLSADTPPSLLEEIEPRLISRFEWGLVLPVHKLEKEHLLQMLQKRCEHLSFPVPEPILKFLIHAFPSRMQSLQKAFEALVLRSKDLPMHQLSLPLAQELLKDIIDAEKKQALSSEEIIASVSKFFSLSQAEIKGKAQTQECVLPRQIAMFLCRNELKLPFAKIGECFKRDHSTVMSSVRAIEEKLKSQDKEIVSHLALIRQKLLNR